MTKKSKTLKQFITEAEEKSLASLTEKEAKTIREITSALSSQFKTQYALNSPQFFETVHGNIVRFPNITRMNADVVRVEPKTLNNVSKVKGLRWVEFGTNAITIAYGR